MLNLKQCISLHPSSLKCLEPPFSKESVRILKRKLFWRVPGPAFYPFALRWIPCLPGSALCEESDLRNYSSQTRFWIWLVSANARHRQEISGWGGDEKPKYFSTSVCFGLYLCQWLHLWSQLLPGSPSSVVSVNLSSGKVVASCIANLRLPTFPICPFSSSNTRSQ